MRFLADLDDEITRALEEAAAELAVDRHAVAPARPVARRTRRI